MSTRRNADDPYYDRIYWRYPGVARQAEAKDQLAELKNMRASGVLRTRIGEREVYFKTDTELLGAIAALEAELNPQRPKNVTAPASVTSGGGVVVGNLFGIAAYDAGSGEEVEVSLVGVFELKKASGQINEGAAVWWNATNGEVSNVTGGGFYPIGVAVKAAGSSDTTCRVRLSGTPVVAAGA